MSDIREIGGKMNLKQSRNTARSDADAGYNFVVVSELESIEGYVETIQRNNPQAAFVLMDSVYVRIATLSDITNIPAFHPTAPGGEYRGTKVTRSFEDIEQAVAWSRKVYTDLNALHNQLKDYLAIFENETETVVIPDTANTELYTRIQSYLAVVAQYETTLISLTNAKAKKDVLNEVYSNAYIENDNGEWQATGGALDVLRSTLPEVRSVLNTASNQLKRVMGVDPGSIQSIPKSITDLQEAISKLTSANSSVAIALAASETAKGILNNFPVGAITPAQQEAIDDAYAASVSAASALNSVIADLSIVDTDLVESTALLTNFRRDAQASSTSIEFLSSIMDSSGVTVNDSTNAVEKMNIVKGINYKKLSELRRRLDRDIAAWEDKLEGYVVQKQEYLKSIQAIYPEVDPNDPMSVFTHRIFRTL